ncbi:MAG TPA: TOBE domain-containing protein [Acidobacteriaceae bacterium]|nr:TOBE domain-containing protein [Acidobacteriaceae bacterium]
MQMNISARNALKGQVQKVNHGAVNTEVIIELSGGDQWSHWLNQPMGPLLLKADAS